MKKKNKLNYFGFSITNWYRHSRNLNNPQKGMLISAIIAFMDDDTYVINDQIVKERYNESLEDIMYMKERAINISFRNSENQKKRWEKVYDRNTTVEISYRSGTPNENENENINEKENFNTKQDEYKSKGNPPLSTNTEETRDSNPSGEEKKNIFPLQEKIQKEKKLRYGANGNVLLTNKEYLRLQDHFGDKLEEWITKLDEGIELKGYKYKSHYLAMLNWEKREIEKTGGSDGIKVW